LSLALAGWLAAAGGWIASTAQADPSIEQRNQLKAVRTLLLSGEASTWLDLSTPPYNAFITVKMKLERAGFAVVSDPSQPHDARVILRYRESPGREYPRMQQGTTISCDLSLVHAAAGTLWTHRFEASTTWPTPVGSLYWDAVQNLEEDPYYYYMGDLIRGRLSIQQDAVAVFSETLKQPPLALPADGSGSPITGQVAANQRARVNAIGELGRLKDRRALETLWHLVDRDNRLEREAAVATIGAIGDPASLTRLAQLAESDSDPAVRAAAAAAIKHIGRPD
jgi:hypothetical protein